MVVIGIGTASRATVADILDVIAVACAKAGINSDIMLATLDRPIFNRAVKEAALAANLPIIFLPLENLQRLANCCMTYSEASQARYGLPSVAEAAALAAAGPKAWIVVPRIRGNNATAAVATAP